MEKCDLVPYDKYQRLLDAQHAKNSTPYPTTLPKRKAMPQPFTENVIPPCKKT